MEKALSVLLDELDELIGLDWEGLAIEGVTDIERAGALLLLTVHKGYNPKVWGKKRKRYWGAFQENIELALMGQDLLEFVSLLAREMQSTIGNNPRQKEVATRIAFHPRRDEIYETIRVNHEIMVTLARVMQEAIKAKFDIYEDDMELEEENA